MKSNEKGVQNAVIKYLALKKYFYWRNNSGALKTERGGFLRFGAVGSPDIFVIHKGRIIGLEIKDKSKQSDGQKDFEAGMVKAGGEYFIIRSIDDIMKVL